jgi:hypothetical protein
MWVENAYLWHASHESNSGTWRNARAVTVIGSEAVKGLNLVCSSTLINSGSSSFAPGLAVVFQQGQADNSDFSHTAA